MEARGRPRVLLLAALLAYFALRALILVTNFDSVAMPQFELFPMGTIPLLIDLEGGLPISRVYDNAAGQIFTGVAACVPYRLFGATYAALKLVPLLLGAATLVFSWRTLRACFDTRTAFVGALLFALGPATLTKYSLAASGNHFETLCFTSLALACWVNAHRNGVTPLKLLVLGLACGFAIFVFLGALTPIGLIVLAHLGLRGWRAALRDVLWLATGFVAGISPLIVISLDAGARGAAFLGEKFSGGDFEIARATQRLIEFFTVHLPDAARFPDAFGLPGKLASSLFLAVFSVAYVALLPQAFRSGIELVRGAFGRGATRIQDALITLLVAYLPLTAIAFALSNLKIELKAPPMDWESYRYFNTHFLFAILIIAIAATRLRERLAWLSHALVACAFTTSVFDIALVDWRFEHTNVGRYYDGFNLKQVANQLIAPRNAYSTEQIESMIGAGLREYRPWMYLGLGRGRAAQQWTKSRGEVLDLQSVVSEFPEVYRDDVARGFAVFHRYLARRAGGLDPRFAAYLESELARGAPQVTAAIEGLATDWEVHLERDTERDFVELDALLASLPRPLKPHFARGYGAVCGRLLFRGIPSDIERVLAKTKSFDAALREPFYVGLGRGIAESVEAGQHGSDEARLQCDAETWSWIDAGLVARTNEIHGPGHEERLRRRLNRICVLGE